MEFSQNRYVTFPEYNRQCITQALRAELSAASSGWENTKTTSVKYARNGTFFAKRWINMSSPILPSLWLILEGEVVLTVSEEGNRSRWRGGQCCSEHLPQLKCCALPWSAIVYPDCTETTKMCSLRIRGLDGFKRNTYVVDCVSLERHIISWYRRMLTASTQCVVHWLHSAPIADAALYLSVLPATRRTGVYRCRHRLQRGGNFEGCRRQSESCQRSARNNRSGTC